MRKITKESAKAFVNFEPYKKDNTVVSVSKIDPSLLRRNDLTKIALFNRGKSIQANLFLHGNRVASHAKRIMFPVGFGNCKTSVDLCGYHTRTTRERINGVLDALGYDFRVAQRKGEQVLVRKINPIPQNVLDVFKLDLIESPKEQVLKLSDDRFEPNFAQRVFDSKEFVSGTDLNAITDF